MATIFFYKYLNEMRIRTFLDEKGGTHILKLASGVREASYSSDWTTAAYFYFNSN